MRKLEFRKLYVCPTSDLRPPPFSAGQKQGGQKLIGGLDVEVSRNFFGAQINSFETDLTPPAAMPDRETGPCRALFIRAPAILEAGPNVEVLSEYTLTEDERAKSGRDKVIVAVREGVLMATAFHPELTTDIRWHAMFVEMVKKHAGEVQAGTYVPKELLGRAYNRPLDMPVYGKRDIKEMTKF